MNLPSALLKQIITQQDFDTWVTLRENYLSSDYQGVYKFIGSHVKNFNSLPTFEDLKLSIRDPKLQEKIFAIEAIDIDVDAWILLEYLKNEYAQSEILDELDKFIESTIAISRAEENVEALQQIVLGIGERVDLKPPEENMQTINLFASEKELSKYLPLGLNQDYDQQLRFTPKDLILIGAFRGGGKTLTCVNIANNMFEQGRSALYFSIEMDGRQILQRACSLGANVPLGKIINRQLTPAEWNRVAQWWANRFEDGVDILPEFYETKDFDSFHDQLSKKKLLDRQIDVVYDSQLTLATIKAELESKLSSQDVGVIIVDYLNQVKRHNAPSRSGQYDWMEQIELSKSLKALAQEYETPIVSAYQTTEGGEVRMSKGILDACDAAFVLDTHDPNENACITFKCTKMRSGSMTEFTSTMDWETLKIGPQSAPLPEVQKQIKSEIKKGSTKTGEDIYD